MSGSSGSHFRGGVGSLLEQGVLHYRLFQVEWELEKHRYRNIGALMIVSVALLICSLLAVGALVMMYSWDTRFQFAAAAVLTGLYVSGALIACLRLQKLAAAGDPFADSRREFAADIALLRERIGE